MSIIFSSVIKKTNQSNNNSFVSSAKTNFKFFCETKFDFIKLEIIKLELLKRNFTDNLNNKVLSLTKYLGIIEISYVLCSLYIAIAC